MENLFNKKRLEVISSFPSIYSKDDVLAIIDSLRDEFENSKSDIDIKTVVADLKQKVEDEIDSFYFIDDIELDTRGAGFSGTIEINADFDNRNLRETLNKVFDNYLPS